MIRWEVKVSLKVAHLAAYMLGFLCFLFFLAFSCPICCQLVLVLTAGSARLFCVRDQKMLTDPSIAISLSMIGDSTPGSGGDEARVLHLREVLAPPQSGHCFPPTIF
jgi:hypothetical protein